MLFILLFIYLFSGYGVDITDSSANVFDHYTNVSVTNCTSTSSGIKFYSSNNNISLDCLLTGDCATDYLYVSSNGLDFNFCGSEGSPCETIVYYI
jgi:hypothetical protein